MPHVIAVAPVLYDPVIFTGPLGSKLVTLKGIDVRGELATSDTLRHLKSGSLDELKNDSGLPGIDYRRQSWRRTAGCVLNSVVTVIDPQGTLTPFGPAAAQQRFRVAGFSKPISLTWTTPGHTRRWGRCRSCFHRGNVVNTIEVRLDNPDRAPEVGARNRARRWATQYATTDLGGAERSSSFTR